MWCVCISTTSPCPETTILLNSCCHWEVNSVVTSYREHPEPMACHVSRLRGAQQQDQGVEEEKLQNGPGSENSMSSAHSYQLRNTRRRCVCYGGLATVRGRVWPGTIVHKGKADNVLSLESQLRATSPRHTNRINGGLGAVGPLRPWSCPKDFGRDAADSWL